MKVDQKKYQSWEEYREEYDDWVSFLNNKIAPFMVASSLSIATQLNYEIFSVVLVIVIMVWVNKSRKFPSLIISLRGKKERTRQENYKYYGIMKTDFGIKQMFTNVLPFTIACFFLSSIYANLWAYIGW